MLRRRPCRGRRGGGRRVGPGVEATVRVGPWQGGGRGLLKAERARQGSGREGGREGGPLRRARREGGRPRRAGRGRLPPRQMPAPFSKVGHIYLSAYPSV